ncbi:GIY-YIG nuclease family protein [Mycoplasmopsis felifaucium]|uniref:Excinuclease cho n=1 Tax=Mycoplasmopsis felifaucium TaxID=35768 RepID=A0ABZ2RP87_9BACT
MDRNQLIEALKNVPKNPGVYLWKDAKDTVLYVGKAKNLRNRMNQYFEGSINSYKTNKLVSLINDFEIFLTTTDKEALLLERRLIEEYNPEYNILLLDDRRYPYLKVQLLKNSLNISLGRRVSNNSNNKTYYYGPFPSGYGGSILLKWLQREVLFENGLKIKNKDPLFWKEQFNKVKDLLSFKNNKYLDNLKHNMLLAAENNQFEVALDLRDTIQYLNKFKESQIIELKNDENIDVLSYKTAEEVIFITILFYRYGILLNKENIVIPINIDEKESMRYFLDHYYENHIMPSSLIVSDADWFNSLNIGGQFNFLTPKIGPNKKILELAEINLNDYYNREHLEQNNKNMKALNMLTLLQKYIPLASLKNIVIFDNSNLNNSIPVGVAITYTNGLKNKSKYRKFNLDNSTSRQADVEYMKQSVTRFFESDKNSKNYDLIIVDGGLQQVKEVKKTLNYLGLNTPVVGLVKNDYHKTKALINLNEEEAYFNEQELYNFMSEIQIEVDRFAKSHLRNKHKIASLEGKLLKIKGLGKVMEQKLIDHFKTYSNVYNASIEELVKVVPKNIAIKIINKEFDD